LTRVSIFLRFASSQTKGRNARVTTRVPLIIRYCASPVVCPARTTACGDHLPVSTSDFGL